MTKDEIYREGKRLGFNIDRRLPVAQMLARLQSEKTYRGSRPSDADPIGPTRPAYLRNTRTGHIWPYKPEWASNPELEPYNEDP